MKTLTIATEFSLYPGLRHIKISDHSGEEFYHTHLNELFKTAYEKNDTLAVNIDGTSGYAPSFLDEAFGNLVYDFGLTAVKEHLEIISKEEPSWLEMINKETYEQWENRRSHKKEPEITSPHSAWYRLIDGHLESKVWNQPISQ